MTRKSLSGRTPPPGGRSAAPASGSATPRPGSGSRRASQVGRRPGLLVRTGWRLLRWLAEGTRRVLALATLAFPGAYLLCFFVRGGLMRPAILQAPYVSGFMRAVVDPGLALYDKLLTHHLTHKGWDYGILGMAVLLLVARFWLVSRLVSFEEWVKKRSTYALAGKQPPRRYRPR